ncbi:MAG TPA: aminotransferase class V-fold PLP-dependent enzyme [Pirellulales bacterium]|nr:aminotransferase class V-fold PLP-dependent enzyme [Pirellulales bacterium]HVA50612.1 aminotransferase class V-fold PLP-dependent enzyme [Pirellulales bacterium]HVA50629.1 aminotransferase class V-fold PLP-dependent enzyme [Pirellulales bacterium]
MPADRVYMDNHATTRVDPRVVEAMLPFFSQRYGNARSVSHAWGWEAKDAVDESRQSIAAAIGAEPREIVFTSGATESNNLALRGVAERGKRKGDHFISLATEHKAVLDPLERLGRRGFEVTLLPVAPVGEACAGLVDTGRVAAAIRDDTALVSVMLANNEIGVIQPLAEIGAICRQRGVLLHCDATQAVGKLPVDVTELQIDLMSFSAHKIYGPKGVGALYVRRRSPPVRLQPQIDGGGQEGGLRSGTLNVPGIAGFAKALELCLAELPAEATRLAELRDRLCAGLLKALEGVSLNGPALSDRSRRLPGNLNLSFAHVDGEALMMSMKRLAVSSGSACTSADPEPSHVLRALGLSEDLTRASLRFGLGRFNTADDVEFAIEAVSQAVVRLRKLSSLA